MPIVMTCGFLMATLSVGSVQAVAASVKPSTTAGGCGKTVGVTFRQFAFSPATVSEGGTATLYMTVANCTRSAFTGSVQTSGMDVCIVVDPVQQRVKLERRHAVTLSMVYTVPDCSGTGTITGQLLSHSGQRLETKTASFQSVVPPPTPTIVANPDSIMVNTATNLTGTNFSPNATLTIKECSQTTWIVPQNPCVSSNVLSVATNSIGEFQAAMNAKVCPSPTATPVATPGFAQNCYIGEPVPQGVDTITLVGATRVTVTGP